MFLGTKRCLVGGSQCGFCCLLRSDKGSLQPFQAPENRWDWSNKLFPNGRVVPGNSVHSDTNCLTCASSKTSQRSGESHRWNTLCTCVWWHMSDVLWPLFHGKKWWLELINMATFLPLKILINKVNFIFIVPAKNMWSIIIYYCAAYVIPKKFHFSFLLLLQILSFFLKWSLWNSVVEKKITGETRKFWKTRQAAEWWMGGEKWNRCGWKMDVDSEHWRIQG